jgi:hypothetical protein
MTWVEWAPTAIAVTMMIIVVTIRQSIKTGVERSIHHHYDAKLELLRGELQRKSEQQSNALRSKEAEIGALREMVLSGRAHRRSLADKRRLDAAERLWSAVVQLSRHKFVSASMAVLKVDSISKKVEDNPALAKFIGNITDRAPMERMDIKIHVERPFVSPISWALFSAYETIIGVARLRAEFLKNGIDPSDLIEIGKIKDILKAALPGFSEYIEKNEVEAMHYLLPDIEDMLLKELIKTIDGLDADDADLARASQIMQAIQDSQTKGAAPRG